MQDKGGATAKVDIRIGKTRGDKSGADGDNTERGSQDYTGQEGQKGAEVRDHDNT